MQIPVFKKLHLLILLTFISLLLISCSKKNYSAQSIYNFKSKTGLPDYGNLNYWAAHPWKWDPSDSIPKPYRNNFKIDSLADVFFIHPTTLTNNNDTRWNAPIDDSLINAATDYSAILYQSSVFNEKCRVFAPRYRQAHLKSFYTKDSVTALAAFDTAYADVKKSFEYYLSHFNNNKPIIIASHSQGTVHAARLLKEFFDNKPLQSKLVCAYIIGMPVNEDYFEKIKPCNEPSATGCYMSWRTYKKGYTDPVYIAKEKFKCLVTNPLTWDYSSIYASPSLNSGGILKNFNKLKRKVVDAQVNNNILWVSKPKFFGNIFLTSKNYHIVDYNLFYDNIRNNVNKRIITYLMQ